MTNRKVASGDRDENLLVDANGGRALVQGFDDFVKNNRKVMIRIFDNYYKTTYESAFKSAF